MYSTLWGNIALPNTNQLVLVGQMVFVGPVERLDGSCCGTKKPLGTACRRQVIEITPVLCHLNSPLTGHASRSRQMERKNIASFTGLNVHCNGRFTLYYIFICPRWWMRTHAFNWSTERELHIQFIYLGPYILSIYWLICFTLSIVIVWLSHSS